MVLENQWREVVTAAKAFHRPYLVPPIIMAAVALVAAMESPPAMEDWVAVGRAEYPGLVIRVQPSQGAEVVAVETRILEVQAAPVWSSPATRKPPATTKAAPRTTTTTGQTASRARPARRGCRTPRTSAYAPRTTTAHTHKRAPRALRVPPDPRETPSRVATRRRALLDRRHRLRRHHRRRHRRPTPPKTRRRRLRRRATRSSPTSPTRD